MGKAKPQQNSQLLAFLAQHGWQFVRNERVVQGNREILRGWVAKGERTVLLSVALQEVWREMSPLSGIPSEIPTEVYEPSEDEKEQLKLQGLY